MPARLTRKPPLAIPPLVPGQTPLLTLDVSSSAIGWALTLGPTVLESFGVILPEKVSAAAPERIDSMARQLKYEVYPTGRMAKVCMEWSSGRTAGRLVKAQGLSILGAAQGAIRRVLQECGHVSASSSPVYLVSENEWTGSKRKATRAAHMAAVFPRYAQFLAAGEDAGHDAADSIGLALWVWAKVRERELIERGSKRL